MKIYCAVLELLHATRQAGRQTDKCIFLFNLKNFKPEHDAS